MLHAYIIYIIFQYPVQPKIFEIRVSVTNKNKFKLRFNKTYTKLQNILIIKRIRVK